MTSTIGAAVSAIFALHDMSRMHTQSVTGDDADESIRVGIDISARDLEDMNVVDSDKQKATGQESSSTAIDITRSGVKTPVASNPPDDEGHLSKSLPDIRQDETRIIFVRPTVDRLRLRSMLRRNQPGEMSIGGNLTHDQGGVLSKNPVGGAFRGAQARIFNVWDLQNLWTPSTNGLDCPFYVQTDIPETLLSGHHRIKESGLASRSVLYFGHHSVDFWECISTVKSQLFSEERQESKYLSVSRE